MIDNEKIKTYSNRYDILAQKLHDHMETYSRDDVSYEYFTQHIDLLNQAIETSNDILHEQNNGLIKYAQEKSLLYSALRLYAQEFGNHIVVDKGVPDGTEIKIDVTVLPITDRYVSVDVKATILGEINDDQYNRGRTNYQKIKDWFALLRQIIRKP